MRPSLRRTPLIRSGSVGRTEQRPRPARRVQNRDVVALAQPGEERGFGVALQVRDRCEAVEAAALRADCRGSRGAGPSAGARCASRSSATVGASRMRARSGSHVERANAEQLLRLVVVGRDLVVAERPGQALMLARRPRTRGARSAAALRRTTWSCRRRLKYSSGAKLRAGAVMPELLALERRFVHDLGEVERAGVARQGWPFSTMAMRNPAAASRYAVAAPPAPEPMMIASTWGNS